MGLPTTKASLPSSMPEKYEISPLKLWSALSRQLATCGQIKATKEQWIGTIRNMQKKGVSPVEIEWSGIVPHLEQRPSGSVPLEELLSFLEFNPPCELQLRRLIDDEYSPAIRYVKQSLPSDLPPPDLRRGRREIRLLHYRDPSFGICIWLHIEVDAGLFGRHRYWSFSAPRGRKHPLANQKGRSFISGAEAMAYGREVVRRLAKRLAAQGFVGHAKGVHQYARWVLTGGHEYTEWLITAPNLDAGYQGPHFDIPDLVAHVRTTERTTIDGHHVLVMEEIQSDWNQERSAALRDGPTQALGNPGNAENYFDEPVPPANPYEHHWLDAAVRMMLLLAADRGFDAIGWLPGKLHAERFPWAKAEGLEAFYDRIVPTAVAKIGKPWELPLGSTVFQTHTRIYRTELYGGSSHWRVERSDASSILAETFPSFEKAEEFRLSKETSVQETVPVIFISNQMRSDIKTNGLPYLGAIGRRASASR